MLRSIDLSRQKPAWRARQRNEAAIPHWREAMWSAVKEGASIHRNHVSDEFLANGVARRLHLERRPIYALELSADRMI